MLLFESRDHVLESMISKSEYSSASYLLVETNITAQVVPEYSVENVLYFYLLIITYLMYSIYILVYTIHFILYFSFYHLTLQKLKDI